LTRPATKEARNRPVRRAAAVVVAMTLLALVATDLWMAGVRMWWDRHSITGSVTSSLLVVAFTGLIVDEVVADRQRRDRSASVAVQALIVYGQIRRTYAAHHRHRGLRVPTGRRHRGAPDGRHHVADGVVGTVRRSPWPVGSWRSPSGSRRRCCVRSPGSPATSPAPVRATATGNGSSPGCPD